VARYLVDECFSGAIVRALKASGSDVVSCADICPASDDDVVLSHATKDGRVLLTEALGFGELCDRLRLPPLGVAVISPMALSAERQRARVARALHAPGERVYGSFVTIDPGRTRLRSLDDA
jgi:predicted nuclease of predicted toxin-antitoxin system